MSTPQQPPPSQTKEAPGTGAPKGLSFDDLSPEEQLTAKYGRRITGVDYSQYIKPSSVSASPVQNRRADFLNPQTLFIGRVAQPTTPDVRSILEKAETQREFFAKASFEDTFVGEAMLQLSLYTIITSIIANPIERARSLAQADFASYRGLQAFDPSSQTITKGVVPGKLDYMSELLAKHPKSNVHLFERPNPYEVHISQSVKQFETELLEYYTKQTPQVNPKYNITPPTISSLSDLSYEQVTKFRADNIKRFENIHIFHTPPSFLSEYHFTSQYTSPIRRSFQITYVEPQLKNIRQALRSMVQYNSLLGIAQTQLLPTVFKLLPIVCLLTFYLPWKSFLVTAKRSDLMSQTQYHLAKLHSTYGISPYFLFYPILAIIGRRYVHKGLLFPHIHRDSPEFLSHLDRVRTFHETHESFKKYLTTLIPQNTGVNKILTHTEAVALTLTEEMEKSHKIKEDIKAKHSQLREAKQEIKEVARKVKSQGLSNDEIHGTARSLKKKLMDGQYKATMTTSQMKQHNALAEELQGKIKSPITNTHDPKVWATNAANEIAKEQGKITKTVEMLLEEQRESYNHRARLVLDRLVAKERGQKYESAIATYAARAEGPAASYFRGMAPMGLSSLVYLIAFVPTYTIASSLIITKYHSIRTSALPNELQPNSIDDLSLEISKAVVPFALSTTVASYLAYPFSTIRSYMMAINTPGYVTVIPPNQAPTITQPIIFHQKDIKPQPFARASSNQQFFTSVREIYRQGGLSGFWRGASIIPFLRLPLALGAGCVLFDKIHRLWPGVHEVIDSQHFFIHQPTL